MRRNNKIIIGVIFAILLVSTFAYAKPFTDNFKGGLAQISEFFAKEKYKPYTKAIDFFFFSLLFVSVYMMGVRYAFKQVKAPESLIAILLGLATAFLLVLGGFSITLLLPFVNWILFALIFLFWWWVLGLGSKGGEKPK